MHGSKEIIDEASVLPVEERAIIVDALLQTLNAPSEKIDARWAETAERRLDEIRSGQVTSIPGDKVFQKVSERFMK